MDHQPPTENMPLEQHASLDIPADEAEPLILIRANRNADEARLGERVLVGRIITQKPLNRVGIKEEWYDEFGSLLCITITSNKGNQTFVLDGEDNLVPQSP